MATTRCCISGLHGVKELQEQLGARGVKLLEGRVFYGGGDRGVPPEGADTPRVLMRPGASRLLAAEQAVLVDTIHRHSLEVLSSKLEESPMAVELAHARYRVGPETPYELEFEIEGLVSDSFMAILV